MLRKMVVSPQVSRRIGTFGLPRVVLLGLLAHIHGDLAREYESTEMPRTDDPRFISHRLIFADSDGVKHRFSLVADDSTSPDHLIVVQISHVLLEP